MKNTLYCFFLITCLYSCTVVAKDMLAPVPADNYLILRSGEKISNINLKQWKQLYKRNKIDLDGRTIVNDSIQWLHNGSGLTYVLSNGKHARRSIEGRVSVFYYSEIISHSAPVDGFSSVSTKYTYYVKKGEEPLTLMSIPSLKIMLADNPEAVARLNELERKIIKRLGSGNQLDIVKFYNSKN